MSDIRKNIRNAVLLLVFAALACRPVPAGAEGTEGFVLPASLEVIEEEAFAGTAVKNTELPESLTTVGDGAFSNIPGLETVTVPATDHLTISDSAFSGSGGVIIRGEEGSYAQEWADRNGLPFLPVGSDRPAALVIGQWHYALPLGSQPGCFNDARAVRGMLGGLSNRFNTALVTDLTADQIRKAIRTAFSGAKDQDVSLLYYSGHGGDDDATGKGALLGVDGSALPIADLAEILSGVKGRVIVILDSCYSGSAIAAKGALRGGDPLDAFLKQVVSGFSGYTLSSGGIGKRSGELAVPKFIVLAAAAASEISGETILDGYRCGIFTYSMLKGLGCVYPDGTYTGAMPADDGDLEVTLEEIYSYAYREANRIYSQQHGVYYGNGPEVLFSRKVIP